MRKRVITALAVAAALALVVADDGWAGRGGGRGGGHRGGHGSGFAVRPAGAGASQPLGGVRIRHFPTQIGSGSPQFHHRHRGRAVFFVSAPFLFWAWPYGYFYAPPPYYYGPDYSLPQYDMPPIYVEKFEGTPTPATPGDIFCPGKGAYYPDVQDCPGGWQRIIHESYTEDPAGSG